MKRSGFALLAVTVVIGLMSSLGVSMANHCSGTDKSGHDAFGSCEDGGGAETFGNVHCGEGTDVGGVGYVNASPSSGQGVQVCADNDSDANPVQGRVTAYEKDGTVTVATDGDRDSPGGAQSWTRFDVNANGGLCAGPGGGRVRQRRSSGGWSGASGGGNTAPDGREHPALADNCA